MPPRTERGCRMPETLSPALLRRIEAATYCGRSTATWDRLVSAGKTPAPIKMGGAVLFRRSDLDKWVEFACPDREAFEALIAAERPLSPPRRGQAS